MADDEIMIEDDAIALEDTEDTVAEDVDVSNIIPFIMERYQRAEDYRYQDESGGFVRTGTTVVCMGRMFSSRNQKNLVYLSK